jgi:hypothetical protein
MKIELALPVIIQDSDRPGFVKSILGKSEALGGRKRQHPLNQRYVHSLFVESWRRWIAQLVDFRIHHSSSIPPPPPNQPRHS